MTDLTAWQIETHAVDDKRTEWESSTVWPDELTEGSAEIPDDVLEVFTARAVAITCTAGALLFMNPEHGSRVALHPLDALMTLSLLGADRESVETWLGTAMNTATAMIDQPYSIPAYADAFRRGQATGAA